jgi:hypothetical protein
MRKVVGVALVLMSMVLTASAVRVPDAGVVGSTVALLGMGLSGLALMRRKFK